jgi:hypothetical protein
VDSYTIFNRAADYPDHEYVVRHFRVRPTGVEVGDVVGTADTLEDARKLIPAGLYALRHPDDAAHVVETWV